MRAFTLKTLRISRVLGLSARVTFSNFPRSPPFPDEENPSLEGATVAWEHPMSHPYNRALCMLLSETLVLRSKYSHLFGPQAGEDLVAKMSEQICKYLKYLRKIRAQQEQEARLTTLAARQQASFETDIQRDLKRADKRRADVGDLVHRVHQLLIRARNSQLHKRRMDTCAHYDRPHWIAVLKHVRPLSMSSDDPATTDFEQFNAKLKKRKEVKYYSTLKTWRSPDLIEFLRLIDLLTGSIVDFGDQQNGNIFRKRRPTPAEKGVRTSTRKPTPKLNREFYSTEQHNKYGPYYRYARETGLDLRVVLDE